LGCNHSPLIRIPYLVLFGWSYLSPFCPAPSVEDVVSLLLIVVLDCGNFFAWYACVGRDIDTSCSLVYVSVCISGGMNPVPYQESRAV
jgi:hypothetical protein